MLETLKDTKEWMDMGYVKDIKDLKIDASLGKEERILSYLEQMENPYEYQDGDTPFPLIKDIVR